MHPLILGSGLTGLQPVQKWNRSRSVPRCRRSCPRRSDRISGQINLYPLVKCLFAKGCVFELAKLANSPARTAGRVNMCIRTERKKCTDNHLWSMADFTGKSATNVKKIAEFSNRIGSNDLSPNSIRSCRASCGSGRCTSALRPRRLRGTTSRAVRSAPLRVACRC